VVDGQVNERTGALERKLAWHSFLQSRFGQLGGPPFFLGPQGSTMEVYGTTKAALNRITSGLAGDLHGTGIRVNTVGPRVAVMSEGFADLPGDLLGADAIESIEDIVEAVVAFCDCPEDVTGRVVVSLELIADWGLIVHGLDGLARV
jgi:citronellol/citronellal dehydrogenase